MAPADGGAAFALSYRRIFCQTRSRIFSDRHEIGSAGGGHGEDERKHEKTRFGVTFVNFGQLAGAAIAAVIP